jgi:lipopolysaccharide export system permease protein
MVKVLHRYILQEILGPFFLILSVFLFVLLMGRMLKIVEMIVRQGVSALEVLQLFFYLIPSFLPLAIPMATLIAAVISFSRLSADMEITAMKASGISLYQMLPPVLAFSALMSLVTLYFTLHGAPWGAYAFRELAFQLARKHVSVALKEGVFNEIVPGLILYAERIRLEDGFMEGIFIHDHYSSQLPLEILAARGRILSGGEGPGSPSLALMLEKGSIYQTSPKESKMRKTEFESYEVVMELPDPTSGEKLKGQKPEELTFSEIVSAIKSRLAKGKRPSRSLLMEVHRRLAIPAGCFVFGILALPLSMQSTPRGRSHGFLLGMGAILAYYLMFSAGRTMAETGSLPPWLGLWAPNLVFGAATLVLLQRTAKERPLGWLVKFNSMMDKGGKLLVRRFGSGS